MRATPLPPGHKLVPAVPVHVGHDVHGEAEVFTCVASKGAPGVPGGACFGAQPSRYPSGPTSCIQIAGDHVRVAVPVQVTAAADSVSRFRDTEARVEQQARVSLQAIGATGHHKGAFVHRANNHIVGAVPVDVACRGQRPPKHPVVGPPGDHLVRHGGHAAGPAQVDEDQTRRALVPCVQPVAGDQIGVSIAVEIGSPTAKHGSCKGAVMGSARLQDLVRSDRWEACVTIEH